MAMANMNLIYVFVTKLWPVQSAAAETAAQPKTPKNTPRNVQISGI